MPVYNVRKYIGPCLRSLKEQSFRDWECIVVDDGSTDGCAEFLDERCGSDRRFKVIHQENMGLAEARNVGIAHASGDSLFFLDSDDWMERDALSYLNSLSEANPSVGRIVGLDIVHKERTGACYLWSITPAGIHAPDGPYLFSGHDCDVGHATACLYVRRNIPCDIIFPNVPIFEDMIFNMGLIFSGMTTLVTTKAIYHYISREGSLVCREVSAEEADRMRDILDGLADRFKPKTEVYRRCRRFLDNALKGKGR